MARPDLNQIDDEFQKVINYFLEDLSKLRSGRATPDIVANIMVDAYDQKMPLNQVANINVVDATLLTVQPWDKSLVEEIRKAIEAGGLGVNPLVDGDLIRLPFPSLTEERRLEYVKILKSKAEETRISIRQIRKDCLLGIEDKQKNNEIAEDEKTRMEKDLQTKVDNANLEIEEKVEDKEKELMKV